MSVINRMLKELEERREDVMQTRIPGLVRAVPARGVQAMRRLPWRTLGGVTVLVLIAVLSWALSSHWHTVLPRVPAPSAPIAPPIQDSAYVPVAPALRTEPVLAMSPDIPLTVVQPTAVRKTTPAIPVKVSPAPPAIIADHTSAKPAVPAESALAMEVPAVPAPPKLPLEKNPSEKSATELALMGRARQDIAATEKVEIIKSAPSGETPLSSMKHVSKEQRADFRYREALALITQGRVQEAQTALDETLRLDPRNLSARQVLLGLLLEAKRYPEAEQLLQDALQNNLSPANNAVALARVQIERGENVSALSTLEKYLPQASGSAAYHGFYAALLQRAGRHTEAISQFQAALKAQPNQANWWLGLAVSLQAEKRNPEAEQAYLRARAGNTLSPELQAFIEQRLKQLQAAR